MVLAPIHPAPPGCEVMQIMVPQQIQIAEFLELQGFKQKKQNSMPNFLTASK